MRFLAALLTLSLVSACDIQQAQQQAAEMGGQAFDAARGAVDTRTACMMAGQSEAFCGCVQSRLGPEITQEHLGAITSVARRTLGGESVETAAQETQNVDTATRDALVQCAPQTAVQEAMGGGEN